MGKTTRQQKQKANWEQLFCPVCGGDTFTRVITHHFLIFRDGRNGIHTDKGKTTMTLMECLKCGKHNSDFDLVTAPKKED